MITAEMFRRAHATRYDSCKKIVDSGASCPHGQVLRECKEQVIESMQRSTYAVENKEAGKDIPNEVFAALNTPIVMKVVQELMIAAYGEGIHAGYRLAQVELGLDDPKGAA